MFNRLFATRRNTIITVLVLLVLVGVGLGLGLGLGLKSGSGNTMTTQGEIVYIPPPIEMYSAQRCANNLAELQDLLNSGKINNNSYNFQIEYLKTHGCTNV